MGKRSQLVSYWQGKEAGSFLISVLLVLLLILLDYSLLFWPEKIKAYMAAGGGLGYWTGKRRKGGGWLVCAVVFTPRGQSRLVPARRQACTCEGTKRLVRELRTGVLLMTKRGAAPTRDLPIDII